MANLNQPNQPRPNISGKDAKNVTAGMGANPEAVETGRVLNPRQPGTAGGASEVSPTGISAGSGGTPSTSTIRNPATGGGATRVNPTGIAAGAPGPRATGADEERSVKLPGGTSPPPGSHL